MTLEVQPAHGTLYRNVVERVIAQRKPPGARLYRLRNRTCRNPSSQFSQNRFSQGLPHGLPAALPNLSCMACPNHTALRLTRGCSVPGTCVHNPGESCAQVGGAELLRKARSQGARHLMQLTLARKRANVAAQDSEL
jgi:hypothetical protein